MNEAPFSWNTTYVTPEGWVCQLTIRSQDSGKDLFDKIGSALDWLDKQQCAPSDRYGNALTAGSSKPNGDSGPRDANDASWCPIHQVAMKRYSKGNQVWYSHQTDEGSWCKGK